MGKKNELINNKTGFSVDFLTKLQGFHASGHSVNKER